MNSRIFVYITIIFFIQRTNGLLRRCISCRSRGELGDCKDPFTMNSTEIENEPGVKVVPCASGWCGKVIENPSLNNVGGFTPPTSYSISNSEYGTATHRMCFQRGPDDGEERCAYTVKNFKKVYMCLCLGDMCNGTSRTIKISGFLIPFLSFCFYTLVAFSSW